MDNGVPAVRIAGDTANPVPVSSSPSWETSIENGQAFSAGGQQAANALQNSAVTIFNPVGSGKTIRVYGVLLQNIAGTGEFTSEFNDTDPGAGATPTNLLRTSPTISIAHVTSVNNIALANPLMTRFFTTTAASAGLYVPGPVLFELQPGHGLSFITAATNVTLDFTFWWTEK